MQYTRKTSIIKSAQALFIKPLGVLSLLAGVLWLLSSCILPPQNAGGGLILSSESVSPSGGRSSRSGRSSRQGRLCEDDSRCEDICEEVYDDEGDSENDGKIRACLELSYTTALEFEDLLEFITTEISSSNLRSVKERTWTKFLDVSIAPWVEAADSASSSEAKVLLAWIAENSRIAQGIVDAYKNYEVGFDQFEGMEELLDSHGCDKNITGSKNFVQIACAEGNNPAMQMYEYLCNKQPNCSSYSRSENFPSVSVDEDLFDSVVAIYDLLYICPTSGGAVDATLKSSVENCVVACSDPDINPIDSCLRACQDDDGDSSTGDFVVNGNNYECVAEIGVGSGVFQAKDKVLTNHHVVYRLLNNNDELLNNKNEPVSNSATRFRFRALSAVKSYGGGTQIIESNDIQWYDTASDIAFLNLDNAISSARPVRLGSLDDLRVLDPLVTIGQPAGHKWIISQGQLTSKNYSTNKCRHCIAHSIPIGGGNSGGPIFDRDGKLVGLIAITNRGYDNLSAGPHIDRIKHLLDHDGSGDVTSEE